MRAQVYSRYGGPEVLEWRADVSAPSLGAHEVLVEIHASSVNPIDWKLRAGHLRWVIPLRLPFVPGRDFAGIVLACGRRATGVAPGDRVFGLAPLRGPGSHAEQIAEPGPQPAHLLRHERLVRAVELLEADAGGYAAGPAQGDETRGLAHAERARYPRQWTGHWRRPSPIPSCPP